MTTLNFVFLGIALALVAVLAYVAKKILSVNKYYKG